MGGDVTYGASGGNIIGGSSSGIGPMRDKDRFFNPYPIEKYATE